MKKILIYSIMCLCFLFNTVLHAQVLNVAAATDFNVLAGTEITAGSMGMTPSAVYNFAGVNITNASTAGVASAYPYVQSVYQFGSNSNAFTGNMEFNYGNTVLNGISPANLFFNIYNGSAWTPQPVATLNTGNSTLQTTGLNGVNLNELTLASLPTWSGTRNTNWNLASNWIDNVLPTAGISVMIPAAPVNQPLFTADITINNDVLLEGSLSIGGKTLTLGGAITGTGKLIGSASSSLVMNASANNTIRFGTGNSDSLLANLTIGGTGTVTLGSGVGLTSLLTLNAGTLNTGNHLTLKSTSIANTAVVGPVSGTVTGKVTVERYVPKGNKAYRDLSAEVSNAGSIFNNWQEGGNKPAGYGIYITGVKGAAPGGIDALTGFDKTATGAGSIFTYGSATWPSVSNSKTTFLDPFMGYRALVRGDRTYNIYGSDQNNMASATTLRATGNLVTGNVVFNTTNVTSGVYISAAAKLLTGVNSFSFITNPYVCPVDWEAVYANAGTQNVTSSYWYFDPTFFNAGFATYITYNAVAHINSNPSASKLNRYIQPGMAFFVQNSSNASPTVTFTETNKVSNSTKTAVFRTEAPNYIHASLWKTIKEVKTNVDGAVAVFNGSFTKLIGDKDSKKILNGGENIFITQTNTDLSIAGLPVPTENEEIKLNLSQLLAGTAYQLQLDVNQFTTTGVEAFIKDNVLNTIVPATEGINFTPTNDVSSYQGRFSVVFKAAKVNPAIVKGAVSIYPNPVYNSKFNLQMSNLEKGVYTIRVISSLGVEVMNSSISNEADTTVKAISSNGLTTGVYTIQVEGKSGSYNTELIVK